MIAMPSKLLSKARKHPSPRKLSERIEQKAVIFKQYAQSGELTTLPGAIQLKSIPIRLPIDS